MTVNIAVGLEALKAQGRKIRTEKLQCAGGGFRPIHRMNVVDDPQPCRQNGGSKKTSRN